MLIANQNDYQTFIIQDNFYYPGLYHFIYFSYMSY